MSAFIFPARGRRKIVMNWLVEPFWLPVYAQRDVVLRDGGRAMRVSLLLFDAQKAGRSLAMRYLTLLLRRRWRTDVRSCLSRSARFFPADWRRYALS